MDGSADFKSNVEFEIGFGFSPLGDIVPEAQRSGRRERGSPVLHYNPSMPIKNIVTEQRITKEKLQRARELRRDMTAAEKLLWNELRANKLGFHFRPPPPSAPPPNSTMKTLNPHSDFTLS